MSVVKRAIVCGGTPTSPDERELEMFVEYLRRVRCAELAGVPRNEASAAIYDDMYPEEKNP